LRMCASVRDERGVNEADPKGKRLDVGEVLEKARVHEAQTTLYMLEEAATRRDALYKLPSNTSCHQKDAASGSALTDMRDYPSSL